MGASNYAFADATRTQSSADFIAATIRGFGHFGGVPEVAVPDRLRSAVTGPDRYDPDLNPAYQKMAQHYGVAVIPARPGKAKDKAQVEVGVNTAPTAAWASGGKGGDGCTRAGRGWREWELGWCRARPSTRSYGRRPRHHGRCDLRDSSTTTALPTCGVTDGTSG